METLMGHINSIVSLDKNEIKEIKSLMSVVQIKKGSLLAEENKICNTLAYINKGYFRVFLNSEIKEITIHLAGPLDFVSSLSSFVSRSPGVENVQAVTDAEIFTINHKELQGLFDKSHKLERLGRLIIEKHFVQKEQRVISLITDSAEKRYRFLLEKHPDFFLNIPLQHIASYLGITPETLSRLRTIK